MYFANGVQIGGTNFYYTHDHLGSIREVTTGTSPTVEAQYVYDPYGQQTQLSGTMSADFGYTGLYIHQPSGLNLAPYRAYSALLGRWISRDPLGEAGGINLYGYVSNSPVRFVDPWGLISTPATGRYEGTPTAGGVATAFGEGAAAGAAAIGVGAATAAVVGALAADTTVTAAATLSAEEAEALNAATSSEEIRGILADSLYRNGYSPEEIMSMMNANGRGEAIAKILAQQEATAQQIIKEALGILPGLLPAVPTRKSCP